MIPLPPSICTGEVFHRRVHPTVHEFTYPVSYLLFDPDQPRAVADAHPLWSSHRPAPARFRPSDYGDGSSRPLGEQARADLATVLGTRPTGPVRMLTQWRRWGWLFNPISVVLVWHDDDTPVGAVLEVTNTPWKERHRYAAPLTSDGDGALSATIDKVLHVSPFLDEAYRYDVSLRHTGTGDHGTIHFGIDVSAADGGEQVLTTAMRLEHAPADRRALGDALRRDGLPTHRVSAGIHTQAARLWRARVPFVPHPRRRRPGAGRHDERHAPAESVT